jgi:ubiquitin C-terminal hydrolase
VKRSTIGIINLNNSCYMSTAIQCLLRCPNVMSFYCEELEDCLFETLPNKFALEIMNIGVASDPKTALSTEHLFALEHGKLSPRRLKALIDKYTESYINIEMHHDASDFLLELLNLLSNEFIDKEKNIIKKTFNQKYESTTKCCKCGKHNSVKGECFMLHLNLSETQDSYDLESCLKSYEEEEDGVEKYCAKCSPQSNQKHTKKLTITHLPQVLFISLKRTPESEHKQIKFPVEGFQIGKHLCNFKSSKNQEDYKLVVITNFQNHGQHKGHYYSYSLDLLNGEWYYINDDKFETIDIDLITSELTRDAVLLMYAKQSILPKINYPSDGPSKEVS